MNLKKIAAEAPLTSGVYIFRDGENNIIYVGKARVLRKRLGSYFAGAKDIKTRTLLDRAAGLETISVKNEYEALLLENTLIKQHNPKYNISLKDGKTYPMIRLTTLPFPRVFRTRHIIEDGSSYFGPFSNIGAIDKMLEMVDRLFPLRKCRTLKKRSAPCMYYHIGRCRAPCCGRVGASEYNVYVQQVRDLLEGNTASLLSRLENEMKRESAALHFEQAAKIRNAISQIAGFGESSDVIDFDPLSRDYIAWSCEGVLACFSVFSMRGGKLTGRELYRARCASDEGEALESFIMAYYHRDNPPPAQIYVQALSAAGDPAYAAEQEARYTADPDTETWDPASLMTWFTEQFPLAPRLFVAPEERHHGAILAMVRQNALEDLHRRVRERAGGPALEELKNVLGLEQKPETIEGFDIAQLDGKYPVASLVSFKNGAPDKKNYRHFRLRSVIGIVDDFAAIREAVERRYSRLLEEKQPLPGLILIDGGIGQVNAAKAVLEKLEIHCGVAGLAKRDEEIWLPGARQPVKLSRRSDALKLLQQVRDETHRFATGLNQLLRSKSLRLEIVESVKGIGKRRAAALMRHFGSLEEIAEADSETIANIIRCSAETAEAARAAVALALKEKAPVEARARIGSGDTADLAEAALTSQ
ncbi:MAG: excinuclease ABC subunit UvrC [Treponema sp.]|jgi:excinuclease ABC subunit C|nr:excinuclease ABC subunit UvrC [Treponema sp.]